MNAAFSDCSFEIDAISIRLGKKLAKDVVMNQNTARNPPSQWKFLCIEGKHFVKSTKGSKHIINYFKGSMYNCTLPN